MSRYCGNLQVEPVLKAAEHWRAACLENNRSVFLDSDLWTIDRLREVEQYFVNRPDEGEGNFSEKLHTQLEPTSAQTKQLVAEMLWVMQLCPDNIGLDAKLEVFRQVWGWSNEAFPEQSEWIKPEVLSGIGSGGVSYNINRWRELQFFTRLLLAFKQLGDPERHKVLESGWNLAEWMQSVPEAETRQLRHMLLYLLFPDSFERIFGGTDRYQIAAHFSSKPNSEIDKMSQLALDREFQQIRTELEEQYKTKDLDFYVPPLWKAPEKQSVQKGPFRKLLRATEEAIRFPIGVNARSQQRSDYQ